MGVLRSILAAAMAASTASAGGVLPHSPVERAHVFAVCAGQYSALAEHLYNFDGTRAETAEARRDQMVQLLEAVLPDALDDGLPDTQAMAWRVEAKAALSGLLIRADFHRDALASANARRAVESRLMGCEGLALGA